MWLEITLTFVTFPGIYIKKLLIEVSDYSLQRHGLVFNDFS